MLQPSGPAWCAKYPTGTSLDDLVQPFRGGVKAFVAALTSAGAHVVISATLRPPQRAYLMHYACAIAGYRDRATGIWVQIKPEAAQDAKAATIGIDWTHGGDLKAARDAAEAMCAAYRIAYPAALDSRHIQGRAIDMTITWAGTLWITAKDGKTIGLIDATNPQLWLVGKSYGVVKLPTDPPHWSDDGR